MPEATDPTFYRSPAAAIEAPPERLAYVAAFDPAGEQRDAMTVIDCDESSSSLDLHRSPRPLLSVAGLRAPERMEGAGLAPAPWAATAEAAGTRRSSDRLWAKVRERVGGRPPYYG